MRPHMKNQLIRTNKQTVHITVSEISSISQVKMNTIFERKIVNIFYVGHPISSDNGLISQKLSLKSEFYYPLHVAMGIAY